MIKIVDSSNTKAVAALLSPSRVRDRATEAARGADCRAPCGAEGDRALRRYARELDGLAGPIEIPRARLGAPRAPNSRAACGPRSRARRCTSAAWRARKCRSGFRLTVAPGVVVEQRVDSAAPRRLLCSGRAVSAAVLVADDGDSRAGRGRRDQSSRSARGRILP